MIIFRKSWLCDAEISERCDKKRVMLKFCLQQNFLGFFIFNLIRRSIENFCIMQKFRDDVLSFCLSRLMRGITTSRFLPLLVMTIQKNRLAMMDEKEVAEVLGSCVASPRMTVEKGYCHLEPRAIARGCKDLINKCRDCIELTRLKQVRIKLKRYLYGDFACAQPLKMTMIICLVFCLGVVDESWAACNGATATTAGTDEDGDYCGSWDCGAQGSNVTCTLSKGTLTISGEGAMKDYWWTQLGTTYPKIFKTDAPWGGTRLTKANIEGNITRIGQGAFLGESYFTEISGMENVETIGRSAFEKTSLQSIDIPNVTELDQGVFYDCSQLVYINMKSDVEILSGWNPFNSVPAMSSCVTNPETGIKTCGSCGDKYVKAGTGCVTAENCGAGYGADAVTKQCKKCSVLGKVVYKGQCLDEYPFAKKHYTPAEAAQWLNEDDNTITLTFKKQ